MLKRTLPLISERRISQHQRRRPVTLQLTILGVIPSTYHLRLDTAMLSRWKPLIEQSPLLVTDCVFKLLGMGTMRATAGSLLWAWQVFRIRKQARLHREIGAALEARTQLQYIISQKALPRTFLLSSCVSAYLWVFRAACQSVSCYRPFRILGPSRICIIHAIAPIASSLLT